MPGIGAIPDAVLSQLGHHKNLGVHSEMFSDGVVELVEKGVITNSEKSILTGRLVSSFSVGTKILYNFLNNNPSVGEPTDYTLDFLNCEFFYVFLALTTIKNGTILKVILCIYSYIPVYIYIYISIHGYFRDQVEQQKIRKCNPLN